MSRPPLSSDEDLFVAHIRILEERLFPGQLDTDDATRMKSDGYSWHYRPSHHVASGLITKADVDILRQPQKRLLSVGAHPAYLEHLLCELGIPPDNMLIADNDPALAAQKSPLPAVRFDMLGTWPDVGTFDRIIFPESLCIALSDSIRKSGPHGDGSFATDALEAKLLYLVLRQALQRLRKDGEIRANGPQSHPNVVKAARAQLDSEGCSHELMYQRYFLRSRVLR